jgi:GGDEF domain-containing protein
LLPRSNTFAAYLLVGLFPLLLLGMPSFSPEGDLLNFLAYLPYLALGVLGFLGWQIKQTRILFTAAFLAFAYYGLMRPESVQPLGLGRTRFPVLLSLGMPAALALLYWSREAGIFGLRTLGRLGLSLLPLAALLLHLRLDPMGHLRLVRWDFLPWPGYRLPDASVLSLAVLAATYLAVRDAKVRPFLGALLAAQPALLFALHVSVLQSRTPAEERVHFVVAFAALSAILLHAIFMLYWRRVYVDELTEVPNRRALDEDLANLSGRWAAAMVDIDHFKRFNDRWGHDEGDNVLRMVARHLAEAGGGKAYRYGGEEFCVLYDGLDLAEAAERAEAMRRSLAERAFYRRGANPSRRPRGRRDRGRGERGPRLRITVSVGVAAPDKHHPESDTVLRQADKALYRAKGKGRNRTETAGG